MELQVFEHHLPERQGFWLEQRQQESPVHWGWETEQQLTSSDQKDGDPTSGAAAMSSQLAVSVASRHGTSPATGGAIGTVQKIDAYQKADGTAVDSYYEPGQTRAGPTNWQPVEM